LKAPFADIFAVIHEVLRSLAIIEAHTIEYSAGPARPLRGRWRRAVDPHQEMIT
jgi:hypothetical protein